MECRCHRIAPAAVAAGHVDRSAPAAVAVGAIGLQPTMDRYGCNVDPQVVSGLANRILGLADLHDDAPIVAEGCTSAPTTVADGCTYRARRCTSAPTAVADGATAESRNGAPGLPRPDLPRYVRAPGRVSPAVTFAPQTVDLTQSSKQRQEQHVKDIRQAAADLAMRRFLCQSVSDKYFEPANRESQDMSVLDSHELPEEWRSGGTQVGPRPRFVNSEEYGMFLYNDWQSGRQYRDQSVGSWRCNLLEPGHPRFRENHVLLGPSEKNRKGLFFVNN